MTRNYFKISLFHWIICVLNLVPRVSHPPAPWSERERPWERGCCVLRDWRVRASTLVLVLRHLIKTHSKLRNWYWFSTAMEVKHFLLLILFQRMITGQIFGGVEDSPYFRSAFFETKENRRLHGRVFKRFESQSAISCTCSCIETDWCSSTNFKLYSKDEDNGTCELNEHSIIDENTELHDEEGVTFSVPFKVICYKPF